MIIEKSFDEYVTEHLSLTTLFDNMGSEPLLHLSDVYYPNLVHEFYVNMFRKIDNKLSTIISVVKRLCIILERVRPKSIIVIRDEGNTVTINSNRKPI